MDLFDTTFVQSEPWRTRFPVHMFSSHCSFRKRYAYIDCRIRVLRNVCDIDFMCCVHAIFDENMPPFVFSG